MAKRKFVGNEPDGAELITENRGWLLFSTGKTQDGWLEIKLVSRVPRLKANYWLAWSGSESRIAFGRDAKLLDADHPDVLDWVTHEMGAR